VRFLRCFAAPGWAASRLTHMTSLIGRLLTVALLVVFSWLAWRENNKPEAPGVSQVSLVEGAEEEDEKAGPPPPPPGGYKNGMAMFTYIVFVAITGGVVVLKWIIPALGDKVADSFYSAPEKVEQTLTHKAMALVAQGEYRKAIELFQKSLADGPKERFALMEMVKLHNDKLGDTDAAVGLLDGAIADESWGTDDRCFFMVKLADIHATQRCDFVKARQVLESLIANHPESNHAANAHHKLHEIEEQELMARINA
jgi:tetratricopeptide (TPR) repeat protein